MEFSEEGRKEICKILDAARERRKYDTTTYTEEEICKMFGIKMLTKKERQKMLKEEMREYYKN